MSVVGVVLPGTSVLPIVERLLAEGSTPTKGTAALPVIRLGNGLVQSADDLRAVKAGLLYYASPNRFWVAGRQRRYVPASNDLVLGIVTARLAEAYRIDLGTHCPATLNFAGFEGSTKKNRPNLSVGDVVFARVSVAHKDLEPELVCFDTDNQPEGFGEIKDGMLYTCSSTLCQRYARMSPAFQKSSLQQADNWALELLGKHFAFEIVVGANGRFVLHTVKPLDTVRIGRILLASASQRDTSWLLARIKEIARAS